MISCFIRDLIYEKKKHRFNTTNNNKKKIKPRQSDPLDVYPESWRLEQKKRKKKGEKRAVSGAGDFVLPPDDVNQKQSEK